MSTPTRDELLLHFGAEVAATRRRLNTIDKQWARTAKTPAELEEARCVVMLSMALGSIKIGKPDRMRSLVWSPGLRRAARR